MKLANKENFQLSITRMDAGEIASEIKLAEEKQEYLADGSDK